MTEIIIFHKSIGKIRFGDNEMTLIVCTCPYCNGEVKTESTLMSGTCTRCGRQVMNENAVVGNINISMDRSEEFINTLKLIKYSMYDGEISTARSLLAKAVQMNPNNSDVWYMDAVLDPKNAGIDINRAKQYPSCGIFTAEDVPKYKITDNSGMQFILVFGFMMCIFSLVFVIPFLLIFDLYFLLIIPAAIGIVFVTVIALKYRKKKSIPEPLFDDSKTENK